MDRAGSSRPSVGGVSRLHPERVDDAVESPDLDGLDDRLLGLSAIPAVTVATYAALRATRLVLDAENGLNPRLFEVLAHLVLVVFALGQAWLLAVNL